MRSAIRLCSIAVALLAIASSYSAFAQSSGGSSNTAQAVVTPSTSPYAAGNCLGGVLTVPNMVRPGGTGGAKISHISEADPSGISGAINSANSAISLLIFRAPPTGAYADRSTCVIAAADAPKLIARVTLIDCPVPFIAGTTSLCQANNLSLPFNTQSGGPVSSSSLWVVPYVGANATFPGGTPLYFNFGEVVD
ncbi:MAG: hypothetical protein JWL84_113 [Rhodospirillales bacterium]|jgi:hypothetical protein|nr:hypothetical protein [Rhodospirillales bacterium]